mmetsp:Transcript_69849/g.221277  ORF Transcript_69849/g.221277 Transcript_69849/m.221277 type:complete len:255 (+) Transcript_69849:1183-1947(+)
MEIANTNQGLLPQGGNRSQRSPPRTRFTRASAGSRQRLQRMFWEGGGVREAPPRLGRAGVGAVLRRALPARRAKQARGANLDEVFPDDVLGHAAGARPVGLGHLVVDGAARGELHDNPEYLLVVHMVDEAVVVLDDVRVGDRRKHAGLIDGLLALGAVHALDLDLLQRIHPVVGFADDLVHRPEGALADGGAHGEVREPHALLAVRGMHPGAIHAGSTQGGVRGPGQLARSPFLSLPCSGGRAVGAAMPPTYLS